MSQDSVIVSVAGELGPFSRTLQREFERIAPVVLERLSEAGFRTWCDEAITIAKASFRSWETAAEYLKASVEILPSLDEEQFLLWARVGRDLTASSSAVAAAYFVASASTRRVLKPEDFPTWADLGRSLHGDSWKSISLASRFFEQSLGLLRELRLAELGVFVAFLVSLSAKSYEAAADCLEHGQRIIATVPHQVRPSYLALAGALAPKAWKPAQTLFKEGPAVLRGVDAEYRQPLLDTASRLVEDHADETFTFLRDCATALNKVPAEQRASLLDMSIGLFDGSWRAVVELLKTGPNVRKRAGKDGFDAWYDHGKHLLLENEEAGTAFFRLQSTRASRMLELVSPGVDFASVRDLLRVYCQALAGMDAKVISTEDLKDRGIGWTVVERPATDGVAIHLPPYIEEYGAKPENFAAYKVLATHQAGHLEFGTFAFDISKPAAVHEENLRWQMMPVEPAAPADVPAEPADLDSAAIDAMYAGQPDPARRVLEQPSAPLDINELRDAEFAQDAAAPGAQATPAARRDAGSPPRNPFERFFDSFQQRQLAKDLFLISEDFRIDQRVLREYAGIRRAFLTVQAKALADRPDDPRPLWETLVETLIRISLSPDGSDGPGARMLWQLLQPLTDAEATVEDSAEATCRLYAYVTRLPNVSLGALRQEDMEAVEDGSPISGYQSGQQAAQPGQPYEGAKPVGYRDDLKPELVETMARVRSEDESDLTSGGISPEELKKLLEKAGELDLSGLSEGEVTKSMGLFVNNLLREAGQRQLRPGGQERGGPTTPGARTASAERHGLSATEPKIFLYDEWDFRANDYRPGWCRLKEQVLREGTTEFFDRTLEDHAGLVSDIRRQFERLRPEAFKKIKRLQDGEEYDLDSVVEAVVERRAGRTPSDKIYWRKNKLDRNVAVAFLLDMSASTDEEIEDRPRPSYYPDTLTTFRWDRNSQWQWNWDEPYEEPRKRIIDVEKESLVLLIKALETIGDTYGIYGFSGYGRENVEFFVIKDLEEALSDRVKRRVERISPVQGTRMGPALRHCVAKLDAVDAKLKLLILVSDGRPQDHDYGRDRTEKEYAIHDTRMALLEAKRHSIVPFCLTVDRFGHDYLKAMCGDIGYEVVSNIEVLPKRLPTLYRRLTT